MGCSLGPSCVYFFCNLKKERRICAVNSGFVEVVTEVTGYHFMPLLSTDTLSKGRCFIAGQRFKTLRMSFGQRHPACTGDEILLIYLLLEADLGRSPV